MSEHSRVWLLRWTTRVTEFNLLIKKHIYVCVCMGCVGSPISANFKVRQHRHLVVKARNCGVEAQQKI